MSCISRAIRARSRRPRAGPAGRVRAPAGRPAPPARSGTRAGCARSPRAARSRPAAALTPAITCHRVSEVSRAEPDSATSRHRRPARYALRPVPRHGVDRRPAGRQHRPASRPRGTTRARPGRTPPRTITGGRGAARATAPQHRDERPAMQASARPGDALAARLGTAQTPRPVAATSGERRRSVRRQPHPGTGVRAYGAQASRRRRTTAAPASTRPYPARPSPRRPHRATACRTARRLAPTAYSAWRRRPARTAARVLRASSGNAAGSSRGQHQHEQHQQRDRRPRCAAPPCRCPARGAQRRPARRRRAAVARSTPGRPGTASASVNAWLVSNATTRHRHHRQRAPASDQRLRHQHRQPPRHRGQRGPDRARSRTRRSSAARRTRRARA